MLLFAFIGLAIIALAHTAPAPFVLDAMAGDRGYPAHAARGASHGLPHVRRRAESGDHAGPARRARARAGARDLLSSMRTSPTKRPRS